MVLILYFDSGYFKWAPLIIESYNKYEPNIKIAIYGINLTHDQIKTLDSFDNINLIITQQDVKFDPTIASRWLYQIVCNKGKYILNAMNHFGDDLFIISDVDMILRKPLTELKHQMKNYDIGFIHVNPNKVMSGFIAIRDTPESRSFINEYHTRATNGFMDHSKDQPVLAKLVQERKSSMKFLDLDRKYLDQTSNNKSFIWSAHKSAHGSKDDRYLKYKNTLENT